MARGGWRPARRRDDKRPGVLKPDIAAVADQREFVLQPSRFQTRLGGLLVFLPFLVHCQFPELVHQAGYPGTKMTPAAQALLSIFGPQIHQHECKSHVTDLVFDEGMALFAGLDVPPKTTPFGDVFPPRWAAHE